MAARGGELEAKASAQQPIDIWNRLGCYRNALREATEFSGQPYSRGSEIVVLSRSPRGEQVAQDVARRFSRSQTSAPTPEKPT